jgi:hypothetical protein
VLIAMGRGFERATRTSPPRIWMWVWSWNGEAMSSSPLGRGFGRGRRGRRHPGFGCGGGCGGGGGGGTGRRCLHRRWEGALGEGDEDVAAPDSDVEVERGGDVLIAVGQGFWEGARWTSPPSSMEVFAVA